MKTFHFLMSAVLAICSLHSASAGASTQPTIFVEAEPGLAWWLSLRLVPVSVSDGGVTLSQINSFVEVRLLASAVASPAQNFIPLCHMDFADPTDVVSSNRETQAEIASAFTEFPNSFRETMVVGDEQFLLRIGIFEFCANGTGSDIEVPFMALVITDQVGAIREFDAMEWPFLRLYKRPDGRVNILGCFECGEAQQIAYNPVDREFYFNWIGH